MNRYVVRIGFWLYAHDGFTVEAPSDAEAIAGARALAAQTMLASGPPMHIELDQRRQGIIACIDRVEGDARHVVAEDIAFEDDRVPPPQ